MGYGAPLGVTVPTVSATVGPEYAEDVNEFLQALQACVEAKVTPAGMAVTSDLSFTSGGVARFATDLKGVQFANQASLLASATYPRAAFFSGTDGDLFVNDGAGNQIQVTSGGALNASTTGGITGAYGTSGVEVNYDAGTAAYRFRVGTAIDAYGDVVCDDLRLNDGSGNFATLAVPAMAADYTWTLPAALPASTSVVTVGTTGTVALTRALSVDSIVASGAGTFGSLNVGSATWLTNLTMAASGHVIVSGLGRFKHGTLTRLIPGCTGTYDGTLGSPPVLTRTTTFGHLQLQMTSSAFYGIPLDVGKRLIGVQVALFHGATAGARSYRLCRTETATDTVTVLAFATSSATSSVVQPQLELGSTGGGSTTLNLTIANTHDYWVEIAGLSGDFIKSIILTYDEP